MSIPIVAFASGRRATIDYLTGKTAATPGTFFPKSSTDTPPTLPFLQVAWDGTPTVIYPITEWQTIRVTWWDQNPSPAEDGIALVLGHMAAHPGDDAIGSVKPLTGGQPTLDPDTKLYLASATFRIFAKPSVVTA